MKDFFISYNKADRSWAEWIAWQLEEAGYEVIIQAWDFRPGSNFILEMQRAAVEAERTIAVLSPDYLAALYTQSEWAAAFAADPTGEKGLLLLARVRECKTEGLLAQVIHFDLFNLDKAAAKRALLNSIKRGRVKPEKEPSLPGSSTREIGNEPHLPGTPPDILNIPHLRNPNFTGREDELAQLRTSLEAGETAALVQTKAIHGLGGVGKTQLAIEYVYRYSTDYNIVWWVRSENPVTLASDYAGLAAKLDLPEKDATEQRVVVEAVKEWLRLNRDWLLVFDNAEDVRLVREYIPRVGAGHIIITSRNPNWTGVATPLSVKAWPLEKAIEFLLKRTGHNDEQTAKALADALGRLPLALEQAGAYIETSRCTMAHYQELFEKRQSDLLKRGKLSTEYPDTVATTWSISFQNVERECPAAAELLRLCAFFAPDDIPVKMLVEGAKELPESLAGTVADSLLLDESLMALRNYSLVEVENDILSIHRLVQAVIRHSLDKEKFKQWAGIAVHVVNTSFPNDSNDVRTWSVCTPLMPHALATLSYAEVIDFASYETSRLFNEVGLYLHARAEYTQAKRMAEHALAIGEATLGSDHEYVAIYINNLGLVLKDQGDLAGAKAHFERALAIGETAFGLNHPQVAIFANNLGIALSAQGDLAGAKAHYERALAISEAAFGLNHPRVANFANNLGGVLKAQGKLEEAQQYFVRALRIDEQAFGPDHPDVAMCVWWLGTLQQLNGNFDGAKISYERALQIFRESLGDDHPYTRKVQDHLNRLYQG